VLGGVQEDLDVLFISGGLAAAETKTDHQPDPDALAAYLQDAQMSATYTIGHLR
jgi:putative intracellular protease/amidase